MLRRHHVGTIPRGPRQRQGPTAEWPWPNVLSESPARDAGSALYPSQQAIAGRPSPCLEASVRRRVAATSWRTEVRGDVDNVVTFAQAETYLGTAPGRPHHPRSDGYRLPRRPRRRESRSSPSRSLERRVTCRRRLWRSWPRSPPANRLSGTTATIRRRTSVAVKATRYPVDDPAYRDPARHCPQPILPDRPRQVDLSRLDRSGRRLGGLDHGPCNGTPPILDRP